MTTTTTTLTLEEWLALPEEVKHHEFVEGEVIVDAPITMHQRAEMNLVLLVLEPAAPEGYEVLTEVGWITRPQRFREPDVVVATIEQVEASRYLESPPLLAVEVLSPDSAYRDLVEKRDEYAAAGLQHYWVVDPREPCSVTVFVREGEALVEIARVVGEEILTLAEPFAVSFRPADLIRRRTRRA